MITVVIGIAATTFMIFFCPRWLSDLMQLTRMPAKFKLWLVSAALVGFGVSMIGEEYVLPKIARAIGSKKPSIVGGAGRQRKKYKILERQMRF
jgi:hypothetical protein